MDGELDLEANDPLRFEGPLQEALHDHLTPHPELGHDTDERGCVPCFLIARAVAPAAARVALDDGTVDPRCPSKLAHDGRVVVRCMLFAGHPPDMPHWTPASGEWADDDERIICTCQQQLPCPHHGATAAPEEGVTQVGEMSREQELVLELRDVRHDLEHVMQERDQALAEAKRLRHELAVARLDRWLTKLENGIEAGDPESIRTAISISKRRADLLGLDATKQIEHHTDQDLWGHDLGVAWRRGAQEWRRRYNLWRDADALAQDAAEERETGADAHAVPLVQAMSQLLAAMSPEAQEQFLAGFVAGEAEASAELSEAEVATTRKPSDLHCAHCGRGDLGPGKPGGIARVRGYSVCHPNDDARPDCYRLVTVHRHPVVGCLQCATVAKGMWYPEMPPALPGECSDRYSNRLIGAYGNDLRSYDHRRNRQCSLGWHNECSDPEGETCECPCHRGGTDHGADATARMPICNVCGHRHRSGGACADHPWRDSCHYNAGADCDNTPTAAAGGTGDWLAGPA